MHKSDTPASPSRRPGDPPDHFIGQIPTDDDPVGMCSGHCQTQTPVSPGPQGLRRRYKRHTGTGRPRLVRACTCARRRGLQTCQRPRGMGCLGAESHQDERRHLLGGHAISGNRQCGDIGIQGRTLVVESLHPRQNRRIPTGRVGIRTRRPPRDMQRVLGGIGIRFGRHQRSASPVTDMCGSRLGRGHEVHHCATAQQGAILVPQDGAPSQCDHALSRRRGVENRMQCTRLSPPEALFSLSGEDLRDGHAGASADLSIGISDLQSQSRGEQPRHCGLAGTGQPHQDQREMLRVESDMRNGTATHRSSPSHRVRSAMRAR